MMETIADKLTYLNGTKEAIKDALVEKGVDMSGNVPFREYADKIRELNPPESLLMYGIEWDSTVADSACTRIGNPLLHVSLPIQSKMRRCLLSDDGTVNYYLDANDSTKRDTGAAANLDGTDGQVMVEIPAHYRKFEVEGTKYRCLLSEYPLPGFHFVPVSYRSAYEATLDRTITDTPKLASVVNTSEAFRGGTNDASVDNNPYLTLLGKPVCYIKLSGFREYARNRGIAGKNGAGWNCDVYEVQKTCYWLYVAEYANFNCRLGYNAEPTSEGYKQGGLGQGCSEFEHWDYFKNPVLPCGVTNHLGNKTGVVNYVVKDAEGADVVTIGVPSYRGLENPFGHLWSTTDGCKCLTQSEAAGGLSEFYVCTDPAKFQSSNLENYEKKGNLPRTNHGYVKTLMMGEYGEYMPATLGADSSTYICAPFDTLTVPSTGENITIVLLGGNVLAHAYCVNNENGMFYTIGSRLCFLP